MATPNSVQFKVTLNRAGQPLEIRRFTIDKDVVTNYAYLRQKLYAVFPLLQNTGMTIAWKDSEGDMVTIGSDEELIIAVNEMEDVCKKLFVSCVTSGGFQGISGVANGARPDNLPKIVHESVSCDGCDGAVVGFRYKCLACPDFDLCFDCEHKGLHPEHVMLRYPHPITREFHFLKRLKKLYKRFDHHYSSMCQEREMGDHCKGYKFRANRCPAMSEDVYELVDDFVSALRTQVNVVTPEIIQQVIDSLSNMNLSGLNAPGEAPADAPDTPQTSKHHGESSSKKKDHRGNKRRGCPFTFAEMRAGDGSDHQPVRAAPPVADVVANVIQQVGSISPHVVPNIMAMLNQMGVGAQRPQPSAPTTSDVPSSNTSVPAPIVSSPDVPTPTIPIPSVPGPTATASSSEPMVITLDDDSESSSSRQSQGAPQAQPTKTTFTNEDPQPPSSYNELVERSLQSMLNMGFSNEGGWLKDVLAANGGDITKVLDLLGGSGNSDKTSPLARLELD